MLLKLEPIKTAAYVACPLYMDLLEKVIQSTGQQFAAFLNVRQLADQRFTTLS